MKHYQTYMDRVKLPSIAHLELMEALERGVPTRRQPRRYAGWAAGLAACGVLALFLGTALWWQTGDPGAALRPGGGEPPTAAVQDTAQPTATPAPETNTAYDPNAYELVVPPLPEGYAFTDEGLDLPDLTGTDCMVICTGIPTPDTTQYTMTAAQILSVFGREDPTDLAISYGYESFTLTGGYILRADGTVWRAWVRGERGEDAFSLVLAPGQEPSMNEHYEGYATWTENGSTVNGYSLYYDSDGDGVEEYHDRVFFESWGTGVYFEAVTPDFSLGQNLTKAVVGKGTEITGGGFTLDLLQSKHSLYLVDPDQTAVERVHPIWESPEPQD